MLKHVYLINIPVIVRARVISYARLHKREGTYIQFRGLYPGKERKNQDI